MKDSPIRPTLVSYQWVNYVKKLGIMLIIISSLGSHLVQNTDIKSPLFSHLFSRLTHLVGMSNHWQMFSVVDRFSWRIEIVAIDNKGEGTVLPIFDDKYQDFFEKNFVDFREGKLHQSLFVYGDARNHYSDYLCRVYQNKNEPIEAIRYDLFWRQILSPGQAEIRKQYLTEEFSDIGKLGEYKCPKS